MYCRSLSPFYIFIFIFRFDNLLVFCFYYPMPVCQYFFLIFFFFKCVSSDLSANSVTMFICAVCDQWTPWKVLPFSEVLTWKQHHPEWHHQLVSNFWSVLLLIFLKTLSSTGCDFGIEYSRIEFSNYSSPQAGQ